MRAKALVISILISAFPANADTLRIYDDEGQFHGCITCSKHDAASVCNAHGTYGSKYSRDSIFNGHGAGSKYGKNSPWNPSGHGMAVLNADWKYFGRLTANKSHPDRLKGDDLTLVYSVLEKTDDLETIQKLMCE